MIEENNIDWSILSNIIVKTTNDTNTIFENYIYSKFYALVVELIIKREVPVETTSPPGTRSPTVPPLYRPSLVTFESALVFSVYLVLILKVLKDIDEILWFKFHGQKIIKCLF